MVINLNVKSLYSIKYIKYYFLHFLFDDCVVSVCISKLHFIPVIAKKIKQIAIRRVNGGIGVRQCGVMENAPKFNCRRASFSSAPICLLLIMWLWKSNLILGFKYMKTENYGIE